MNTLTIALRRLKLSKQYGLTTLEFNTFQVIHLNKPTSRTRSDQVVDVGIGGWQRTRQQHNKRKQEMVVGDVFVASENFEPGKRRIDPFCSLILPSNEKEKENEKERSVGL